MTKKTAPVAISQAGQILFGRDYPHAILEAYQILMAKHRSTKDQLMDILSNPDISMSDVDTFPLIIEAVFAESRWTTHLLLKYLRQWYDFRQEFYAHPLAMTLGLFRATEYVKDNPAWFTSQFAPQLTAVLLLFVFEWDGYKKDFSGGSRGLTERGMFSEAVTQFVRLKASDTNIVVARHSFVREFLRVVKQEQTLQHVKIPLSSFGKVLLSEFTHKLH